MKNFIKKIKSMLFGTKDNLSNSTSKDSSYFDIFVSLDKNFDINVLVYINDSKIETMTENDTALIYSEFLNNCFTSNLQNTILQILEKDIKDDNNQNLINKINTIILYNKHAFSDDTTYIKPSQVFTKYLNDIQ